MSITFLLHKRLSKPLNPRGNLKKQTSHVCVRALRHDPPMKNALQTKIISSAFGRSKWKKCCARKENECQVQWGIWSETRVACITLQLSGGRVPFSSIDNFAKSRLLSTFEDCYVPLSIIFSPPFASWRCFNFQVLHCVKVCCSIIIQLIKKA